MNAPIIMTKTERKRVSAIIRATEYLFLENLALKLVLDNREVKNWPMLVERIIKDPELLAGVHLKFADLYKELERSENPEKAMDTLLGSLPIKQVN
ncbi:MAG TPA: hypothetical protein VFP40_12455 [Terriglobales bacterium]|nr:hypothetical protein [Terriglobales bacterium]